MARTTALGAALPGGAARRRASCASASCRGASHVDLRRAPPGRDRGAAVRRARARRAGRRRGARGDVRRDRRDRRRDARRAPALPDGRRHARGHLDGDRRRRRHVRLRDADAQRAQRAAVRARRPASTSPTRSTATTRARSRTAARASAARPTAGATWRTCSAPRSCCTTGSRASTTSSILEPRAARARGDRRRRGFSLVAVVVLRAWRSGWASSSRAVGDSTAATSPRRCCRCWSSNARARRRSASRPTSIRRASSIT